jgi:radical SAM protein with 4Fe4S-binding SPASM domain
MWWWWIVVNEFILQWHLSEICNLKCKHCYQENHKPVQLKYKDLLAILDQYKELLKKLKVKGHINLTGGEPLCCPYFFKLLDEFKKDKDLYSFSILTNGTLITKEIADKISSYNPEYVQVSLEGGKKTNDYVRGKGVYKKVAQAIKYLKKNNIFTSISFTATKLNYKEFPKVVRFAEKHRVDNVWSDRYIPFGSEYDKDFIMNVEETQEYLDIMHHERVRLMNKKSKTHVSMYRALQFLRTGSNGYHCTAGISLLTVMENGDLVPCRRMPIVVGNVLVESMYDLYMNNEILKDLRKKTIPEDCKKCEHSDRCRGGLKCLTYAITGNYNLKDVGCDL